jgi:hypothetical protein
MKFNFYQIILIIMGLVLFGSTRCRPAGESNLAVTGDAAAGAQLSISDPVSLKKAGAPSPAPSYFFPPRAALSWLGNPHGYTHPGYEKEANATLDPRLTGFIETVKDEKKEGLIVGVYAPNAFAAPVVQQPSNDPVYVSPAEDKITQFRRAQQAGSIGLLAHNYLAGQHFFELSEGEKVYTINWDGSYKAYQVYEIEDYQALTLYSFKDVETEKNIDQYTLFDRIYRGDGDKLVLQTCIKKDNDLSWGRRFILAMPVEEG